MKKRGEARVNYQTETASKKTSKPTEWKETVLKPVSTAERNEVSSDPCNGHELAPTRNNKAGR